MKHDSFGRLYYLNNFDFSEVSDSLKNNITGYIDYALNTDELTTKIFLCGLKDVYKYNNYMYILEKVCNCLADIYNKSYADYTNNKEYFSFTNLGDMKSRYLNVLAIYDENLNRANLKNMFKNSKLVINDLKSA